MNSEDEMYRGVPVEDLPYPPEQMETIRTGNFPVLTDLIKDLYPEVAERVFDDE